MAVPSVSLRQRELSSRRFLTRTNTCGPSYVPLLYVLSIKACTSVDVVVDSLHGAGGAGGYNEK